MAYVTATDLKAYLKITTAAEDTLLATFCTRAEGLIDHWTDTKWEAATATLRRFDAAPPHVDGRALTFAGIWAAEVTAVVNGDGVTIPSSAYVTMPRQSTIGIFGIEIKAGASYTWTWDGESPEETIQITAFWARAKTPPAFITAAALRLAAYLYRQKDGGADADRAVVTGDGVTLMPSRVPADILDLLRPVMSRGI
jgi:DNA-binding transcriptional LysR family regulator